MKTQHIILGIVAVLLIGGGIAFFNSQSASKDSSSVQNATAKKEEIKTEKPAEGSINANSALASHYIDYSADNLAKATASNGRAVIWFAALAWCPSCQASDRDFKAHFDKVPKDVTIMKINYDTAKELKQKYAITMQDTFIQIDSKGSEIIRWNSGGQGTDALIANLR